MVLDRVIMVETTQIKILCQCKDFNVKHKLSIPSPY